jgi:hypothetical protein
MATMSTTGLRFEVLDGKHVEEVIEVEVLI